MTRPAAAPHVKRTLCVCIRLSLLSAANNYGTYTTNFFRGVESTMRSVSVLRVCVYHRRETEGAQEEGGARCDTIAVRGC
jgi:hypothetical protein